MAGGNLAAAWRGTDKQRGFILWEAVVVLPLLTVLLLTMTTLFMWSMRLYFTTLADAELEQEVQMALARVREDVAVSMTVSPLNSSGQGFKLRRQRNPLRTNADSEAGDISYYLHEMTGTYKLVRGDADAPLTGDHALAHVTITEFTVHRDENYGDVYKLRLTGKSEVTGHEYTLSTAVYLHGAAEQD